MNEDAISPDFEAMRRAMVASQLRTTAVSDPRVVAAMMAVPRERFVPADRRALAYIDRSVALGGGRSLNQPMATGRLLNEARVKPSDRVLLVGAASGYTAAVLARLAGAIVALEEDKALLAMARGALADMPSIAVVEGELALGWTARAPYDLILVDGRIEHVPEQLVEQLADGGRLAAGVEERGVSRLAIGRRSGAGFALRAFADSDACALPGFVTPKLFQF